MTSKELFYQALNALADSINTKAGLTGKKTLVELKEVVDNLVVVSSNRNANITQTTDDNTNTESESSDEDVENRR